MDINTTEENLLKEKPSEIVCTFCMKPTCQDFANIQQKSDLLELLKKLNVDILPINGQIDWICYQCTYKLNCIRDYARTWSSCVTKNRINYYYRLGEKEMVRRLLNLKSTKPLSTSSIDDGGCIEQNNLNTLNNENDLKIKISSVRSIDAKDMPKTIITIYDNDELSSEQKLQQQNDDKNNDNNEEINRQEDEPELSVMYEKSESIILTESGRCHRRKKTITPTLLTCKQCHRVYKKLSFLKKHERKHERDLLLKSNLSQNTQKTKRKPLECNVCEITFKTLLSWRKHKKIHHSKKKPTKIPAVIEIPDTVSSVVELAEDNNEQPSHRYMTRSAHQTKNDDDNDSNSEGSPSDVDSTYTKRLKNANVWLDNAANNHENHNNDNEIHQEELNSNHDDDDCQSLATSFTRVSSRLDFREDEDDDDDDDDYDDLSTLTRPSAPSKDTIYHSRKRSKQTDEFFENDRKRCKISEYNKLFECPESNCYFTSTTINRLMEHDLTVHDELPLHFCKKCEGRFVRHLYLKDHLCEQNPGRFICTKCEMMFIFEHEFKLHLLDHNTLEEDNKVNSNYCKHCNLFFTTTSDYYIHLETARHNDKYPNIDRKIKLEDKEIDEKIEPLLLQPKENNQEDLCKDEMKSLIYEEVKNEIKINSQFTSLSKTETFISKSEKNFGELEKENIKFKFKVEETEEKPDSPIFTAEIDDKIIDDKTIAIKSNKAQPYKSVIKICNFSSTDRRRYKTIFRKWKPHKEPKLIRGGNYYNCSIRPYIKSSSI